MEIEVKKKRGGNRHKILDPVSLEDVIVPFPLVNKPKLRLALTVSARGSGLCMYIPKEECDLYGIIAGHILVVKIDEHYRKRQEDA